MHTNPGSVAWPNPHGISENLKSRPSRYLVGQGVTTSHTTYLSCWAQWQTRLKIGARPFMNQLCLIIGCYDTGKQKFLFSRYPNMVSRSLERLNARKMGQAERHHENSSEDDR